MSCAGDVAVALRHDRHRSKRGGVVRPPRAQRAVEHQSAAKKFAHEEIKEIAIAPAAPEEELGRASGGRVIAQRRRIGADGGDFAFRVEIPPRVHGAGRRADLGLPVPQLEGPRDAEARDPPLLRCGRGNRRATAAIRAQNRGSWSASERHTRGARDGECAPRKSISTRSQLRRPILSPKE